MITLQSLPRLAAVALLALAAGSAAAERIPEETNGGDTGPLATVRAFMAAFNDHDVDAMGELLSPDAGWHSISGAEIVIEAGNRAELLEGMEQYFSGVPDVHSSMEAPLVDGTLVAFRERVSWDGGTRSQTAIAVYEVSDGRISGAWYFPTSP